MEHTVISSFISKLYYLSDTHLEHLDRPIQVHQTQPSSNEDIALLVDIGWIQEESYWNFIRNIASMYRYVFIVLGNHECYYHEVHEIYDEFSKILHTHCLNNVYMMQNRAIEFKNCIVWGATLWSKITVDAFYRLNDQNTILDKSSQNGKLRMGTLFEEHNRSLTHLRKTMDMAISKKKPLVVLTHHAPLMEMNGKYTKSITASGYASDLSNYFKSPILTWVCGHTHQNMFIEHNEIRCQANCCGYPGEYLTVPYDPEVFISIK